MLDLAAPEMTDTMIQEVVDPFVVPYEDVDDPNHRTHVVAPPQNTHIWREGMTMQEVVQIAMATDQEVVALCGFRWVPRSNPEKYKACRPCFKIADHLLSL